MRLCRDLIIPLVRWRVRHHAASRPLWPGGGGVCPARKGKGRRGRGNAASKLPVAREIWRPIVFRSSGMTLRFNMLLADAGIDISEVRFLRHQTKKVHGKTPYSLWRDDRSAFETYQSTQDSTKRAWFKGQYWASFVSPPQGGTLFVGLYKVLLSGSVPEGTIDPFTNEVVGGSDNKIPYDRYEYQRMEELSEYIGRLYVEWGDSPSANRAWVQRADSKDKPITELTTALQEDPFPGFTKLIRPLSEVETMPSAWKEVLRVNKGVYLLVCPRTREHYIGSAYGEDGFMGRWSDYVSNNHGGNIGLKARNPSDYIVSILEVAGSSASTEEIISLEETWKKKLHSRVIGLNF